MAINLLLAFLWLLPCAWQDWRTGEVANWLTIPALVLALLARLAGCTVMPWLGILIFIGIAILSWYMGVLGGADAKGWITFALLGTEIMVWAAVGQLVWYMIWKLLLRKQARFRREIVWFPGFALGIGMGMTLAFFPELRTFVP